jgi:hypothetical protein
MALAVRFLTAGLRSTVDVHSARWYYILAVEVGIDCRGRNMAEYSGCNFGCAPPILYRIGDSGPFDVYDGR